MKKTTKFLACGTSVLFAAALSLQAQTSTGTSGTTGSSGASSTSNAGTSGSTVGSGSSGQSSMGATSSTAPANSQVGSTANNNTATSSSTAPMQSSTQNASGSFNGAASGSASGSMSGSANTSSSMQSQANQSTSPSITYPANGTATQSTFSNTSNANNASANTANVNTTNSTTTQQNFFAGGTTTDAQVTTFVQQLDTQGPAVVQRISTQVGDLACSNDTIDNLVNALHSGQTVTITANGQSATFNPQGAHLGYGESYLALALAAQELRDAGINSCATPEQWQAVLFGGPLAVSQTSTGTNTYASASSSNTVQGIVTLHNQGQGWGQIAQTNHVQLGQIVSNANFSSTSANNTAPSPTGFSSAQASQGYNSAADSDNSPKTEKKHHWWNREKKADKDANSSSDMNNANSNNGSFSSSHADTSGNTNSSATSNSSPTTK